MKFASNHNEFKMQKNRFLYIKLKMLCNDLDSKQDFVRLTFKTLCGFSTQSHWSRNQGQ